MKELNARRESYCRRRNAHSPPLKILWAKRSHSWRRAEKSGCNSKQQCPFRCQVQGVPNSRGRRSREKPGPPQEASAVVGETDDRRAGAPEAQGETREDRRGEGDVQAKPGETQGDRRAEGAPEGERTRATCIGEG